MPPPPPPLPLPFLLLSLPLKFFLQGILLKWGETPADGTLVKSKMGSYLTERRTQLAIFSLIVAEREAPISPPSPTPRRYRHTSGRRVPLPPQTTLTRLPEPKQRPKNASFCISFCPVSVFARPLYALGTTFQATGDLAATLRDAHGK